MVARADSRAICAAIRQIAGTLRLCDGFRAPAWACAVQTVSAMCLGVPGRVLSIDGDIAQVDFWGVTKAVRLDVIDTPVAPGDYILNHVGFAIRRIPPDDIAETLALYDELIRDLSADDLMAADVRGELEATGERGAR